MFAQDVKNVTSQRPPAGVLCSLVIPPAHQLAPLHCRHCVAPIQCVRNWHAELIMIPADSSAHVPSNDSVALALEDLVLFCQETYRAWEAAVEPVVRAGWGERYRAYTERLWYALADDLRVAARAWMNSGIASDIESMALHLFSCLIPELPKLRIDPARNVRNFLLTVARRSLIDEYRKSYKPRQSSPSTNETTPTARLTRMWHALVGRGSQTAVVLEELADQRSHEAETILIEAIDRQHLLSIVHNYWNEHLAATDLRIMHLRYDTDPPMQYDDIAQRLGNGWTSMAVRQRHHRVMKATREYLQGMGAWLNDEP